MIKLGAPHLYVAHPMGAPHVIMENVRKALAFADQLFALGAVPHVPGLCVHWDREHHHTYEEWMAYDFAIITRCDALVRVPGVSPGADREVAFAERAEMPLLYSVEEARDFVASWKGRIGETVRA